MYIGLNNLGLTGVGGKTLGPELVTNGTFNTDLTGWATPVTAPGTATWDASGGVLMDNFATGTSRLRQALTVPTGSYLLSFDIRGFTGSTSNVFILAVGNGTNGGSEYGNINVSGNGTYTVALPPVSGPTLGLAFIIVAGIETNGIVDNVSVKQYIHN